MPRKARTGVFIFSEWESVYCLVRRWCFDVHMASEQQSTLLDHGPPTTLSDIRTGVLEGIGWSRRSPRLHFADADALSLGGLLNRRVHLSLSDERVCTTCLEPASGHTCDACSGTPPSAPCVWNPGVACTYQDCPFPEFRSQSCSHDFVVYLAAKDRVKVGIAREGGRTKRWKSQGATHALVFATAPNRKVAGIIETCCAEVLPDHAPSDWFIPLDDPESSLLEAVTRCVEVVPDRLSSCIVRPVDDASVTRRRVVELAYPQAGGSDSTFAALDTLGEDESEGEGRLLAVRGDVLATNAFAFNVKRHRGRTVTIATEPDT